MQSGNFARWNPQGFNDRNLYPAQTPCDQDFLRKLARESAPTEPLEWYNRHVVTVYKELGAFDADRPVHGRRHLPVRAQPSLRASNRSLRRPQPSRQQEQEARR